MAKMQKIYPEWATEKQKEGMVKFRMIADEFGQFNIEFKDGNHDDDTFKAVVTWENYNAKGRRKHEFRIGWNYERKWDKYGDIVEEWQFVFGDGDCTREMATEMFYASLFFYIDELLNTKNNTQKPDKAAS